MSLSEDQLSLKVCCHDYFAFGMHIESEFEIPLHVAAGGSSADVRIVCGEVAKEGIESPTFSTPFVQIASGHFWFQIPGCARFLVKNGDIIIVDVAPDADEQLLKQCLADSCMAALLHQRGILALHASAVRFGDGVVLIAGASGSGKSSLAMLLQQQGYEVLADDLCAIDGEGRLLSGGAQLHLWQDVAQKLGIDTAVLEQVRPNLARYAIPLISAQPLPVRAVYILKSHNLNEHLLEQRKGTEKFLALQSNTIHPMFVAGLGLDGAHMKRCCTFASKVDISCITRPDYGYRFKKLLGMMMNDLVNRAGLSL